MVFVKKWTLWYGIRHRINEKIRKGTKDGRTPM
jgi:hypothetical protein